jgi:hypothetical protein
METHAVNLTAHLKQAAPGNTQANMDPTSQLKQGTPGVQGPWDFETQLLWVGY